MMVVGGNPTPVWTEDDLHAYRKLAVRRLEWACGYPPAKAVPEEHERYRVVTADLDPGSRGVHPDPFSSCALLAHWLYLELGVSEPWLDHPKAPHGWRGDGAVLYRLVCQSVQWDRRKLEGGDVLIIADHWPSGTDAHVVCVLDEALFDDAEHWLATAEYGQPGGVLKTKSWNRTRWGNRLVRVVLPLERVLRQAFMRGLLDPFPDPAHVPGQGA
jgi:hypothetical protein